MVVRRSARTAAALLLGTLKLQGWFDTPDKMVIAVDGGVVLKYHNWRRFLDQYLRELLGKGRGRGGGGCRERRLKEVSKRVNKGMGKRGRGDGRVKKAKDKGQQDMWVRRKKRRGDGGDVGEIKMEGKVRVLSGWQ